MSKQHKGVLIRLKNIFYNWGYFLKEVKTSIRLNLIANLFSSICIGLIFFILSIVVSGWWISGNVVEAIQKEAEISVYFQESLSDPEVMQLSERINQVVGVREAQIVNEQEAHDRMVKILGNEAHVLEVFDDSPFTSFIEVNIQLDKAQVVLEELNLITGIEHIRDNQEVLSQLQRIVQVLSLVGYLGIIAVSLSTLIITSHIIRLGIYARREEINTLRLLGAPETFIAFPFLLEGFILSVIGGLMAVVLNIWTIHFIYSRISGALTFIPLLPAESLVLGLSVLILSLSMFFGVIGSSMGFFSAKKV